MVGISLGTALLGSAIVGGAASIAGAASNSSAINKASSIEQQNYQASLAAQKEARTANEALMSGYVDRGNAAGEAINALLGITPKTQGVDWTSYVNNQPDVLANYQKDGAAMGYTNPVDFAKWHYEHEGGIRDLTPYQTSASGSGAASDAFNNYLNSAGYQFQLGEANKAVNAQFRAAGAMDSGAAVKAAQDRAVNLGTGFFNNYLTLLGNQQGVGLSGASAVAGVNQNSANNITSLNNTSSASQGNLALMQGQNTTDLLSGLSSSFGLGAGALTKFGGSNASVYGGNLGGIY